MTDERLQLVESLIQTIPQLTSGQLHWLHRVVTVFSAAHHFNLNKSDLFDTTTLRAFGDAIRVHHSFSAEAFSKDKFEYVLIKVLTMNGHSAALAPKGNPGYDAIVDNIRLSLKTQADRAIREEMIWISKFMELGRGQWGDNPGDLEGLRDQFLKHMQNYDRILSLRALTKTPVWKYELVEIPKTVLERASEGQLEMMTNSTQSPKPGYCYVRNNDGIEMFRLYFDGGGERKLQIKNMDKRYCKVHATWEFVIPPE